MSIIIREKYESSVKRAMGKGNAIVLVGHRRAGKSIILKRLSTDFEMQGNVIFIDMEDPDFSSIRNSFDLNEFIKGKRSSSKHNYLLIDEVQEIDAFEKTLRFWAKQDDFDVIVTGSNAYLLSSEIATLFAGRHTSTKIYGLSYEEFLEFYQLSENEESFVEYMKWGGLPFLHKIPLSDERSRTDYLGDIYNTIFVKDILTRHKIRNVNLLNNLAGFIAENCGKLFSPNSIAKFLKNDASAVTANTISEYMGYLCETYLIDKVERYDIKGKKVFEQQEKYYFEDIGIRNYLCRNKRSFDVEKIMENLVYLHLKQLGYDVYVGQLNGKEVDFVAKRGDDLRYYQVSKAISSEETYEREYGNLRLIQDNYPKFVITMDPTATLSNEEGIQTILLRKFLME
ncbi:MAG: ATP-binding protein [Paludibacteraceae bacterium]|nr:ATP-binding protein [Paludibacteraceae bacterium]